MDTAASSHRDYPRRLGRRLLAAYHGFNEHDGFDDGGGASRTIWRSRSSRCLLVLVAGLGGGLWNDGHRTGCPAAAARGMEHQISPELSKQVGRAL